jgi:glycosyltransferase involved in cell wall biosynthesis
MKILQVLAGAAHGGAETAFVDTCIAMKEAGQDVQVVTRPNDIRVPQLKAAGIIVHLLPFGGILDIYTPYAMDRIIKAFKPDIVQTWMSRAAQKTPKWTAAMGIPRYLVVPRLGGYYKIKNFKSADYFTTITPDIRRYLIEKGIEEGRVRHINNFAETESGFTKLDRARYGVKPMEKIGISLGRLHTSKAFDTLIRSVVDISDFHLFIAGEGPDRPILERLIADLGLGARVHLLGWRSDRAALMDMADICIFPSRYEPFGTVFVQAWANKIPLITTDSDGPRQFVHDGEDGLVVLIDDVAAMTAAIKRMLVEPELASNLVQNGYQRYLQEFTKEKTIAAYLDYFNEIRAKEGLG